MTFGADRFVSRVELHGFIASIDVPVELQGRVEALLSGYPPASSDSLPHVEIRAEPNEEASFVWYVMDGERKQQELSSDRAAMRIEWCAISRALEHWDRFIHVHAGLVANDHVSALLIGRSGSGKSTTTVGLATRGLTLFSDDVALVDRSDFTAWACPRPIKLDDSARELLHPMGITIAPGDFVDESVSRKMLPGFPDVNRPGPQVAAAFFFSGRRDESASIRPITKSEAVLRLTWQSTTEEFDESGPSDAAIEFVESLRCYELTPGSVEDTVGLLASVMRDLPGD